MGHCQEGLETALRFCGVDVLQSIALDAVGTPEFSAWRRRKVNNEDEGRVQNSYWFESWNKQLERTARHAAQFCRRNI